MHGQLVWARLGRYPWWPAMVVHHVEAGQKDPGPNCRWVEWFGEATCSKVFVKSLEPFHKFNDYFSTKTFEKNKLYRDAIGKVLEVAVLRSDKYLKEPVDRADSGSQGEATPQKVPQKMVPPSMLQSCEEKILWAREGFLPHGPSSLDPTEDFEQVTSDDEEINGRFGADAYRAKRLKKARKGIVDLKGLCVSCGISKVVVEHPLVEGGLCEKCKVNYQGVTFLYDPDYYQVFCSICARRKSGFICDSLNCSRLFCANCVDAFEGLGAAEEVKKEDPWMCYMCKPEYTGFLQRRADWKVRLVQFFARESSRNLGLQLFIPLPVWDRRPLRVLSLFDGVATGILALRQLGIKVNAYYASEIDNDAVLMAQISQVRTINFVGDVRKVSNKKLRDWGPFDLLLGGSPCNELSLANPKRKGLCDPDGSGVLFFEYLRILEELKQSAGGRPFFWLFENVSSMRICDKKKISEHLKTEPVTVDAKVFSPACRARLFWGNIPAMDRPQMTPDSQSQDLQSCLMAGRTTKFSKIRTVTTNAHSLKQGKDKQSLVMMGDKQEGLCPAELERVFGLPAHMTNFGNLSSSQRQKLVGKAWSVPVIKHLLAPLREYYASVNTQ